MPPTVPAGLPCIGVVFAKLIVDGENRGHRPFVVPLNDGKQMCSGVQSRFVESIILSSIMSLTIGHRLLPFRGGPHPVLHSLTTFTNVRLPPAALLGSLERPENLRANLMDVISRVNIGTIAIGCFALPALQCYATIGTLYSLRRCVGPVDNPQKRTPILSFRTQQAPILSAAANAFVLQAFQQWTITQFCTARDSRVRAGIAAVFKSVMVQHSLQCALAISERCGAQGLFAHNQITSTHVWLSS